MTVTITNADTAPFMRFVPRNCADRIDRQQARCLRALIAILFHLKCTRCSPRASSKAKEMGSHLLSRCDPSSAARHRIGERSEEHTSELQSLMRISYAVFCLKKKKKQQNNNKCH